MPDTLNALTDALNAFDFKLDAGGEWSQIAAELEDAIYPNLASLAETETSLQDAGRYVE